MLYKDYILLEKYQIIRMLGRGGMSCVWLAEDLHLKKKWAVKEIFKDSREYEAALNPDGTLTEVLVLSMLDHPFAPRIVDRYEDERIIAIVMDYIEGKTLQEILNEEGPQTEEKVLQWMISLLDLLEFLHTREDAVVYNDVKPENMILKEDGTIRVIDYGIAKIPGKHVNHSPIGTPGYASPEHFSGKTDARSDIYSAGITLYALLTGDNPSSKGFKMQALRKRITGVSKVLESIVDKSCQVVSSMRYQSAAEMKEELQKYLIKKYYQGDELAYTQLLSRTGAETTVLQMEKELEDKKISTIEKKSSAAGVLQVLFNAIGSIVRVICWIIVFCLAAVGMITLLDVNIRPVFLEEIYALMENL